MQPPAQGPEQLSTFFNSETVNWSYHHLILGFLGLLGAVMTLSLRAAAIASVMVVVASTVMAQTTGAIPTPDSPSQLPPPPTANQYSSNDIIDAGHRFFGGVSRDLA
ncbi:MAG TPA: hypothetical protein VF742_11295, partial [Terracidiphilus sp.]